MKKLVLLAAVLALGVTSCSKDDKKDNQAELAGKWEYTHEGNVVMGQEFLTPYEHTQGCTKDFMVVNATTVVDHSFEGSTCTEDIYTQAYSRNGNTLTVMVDGQPEVAEILVLNNSTLKIKYSEVIEGQSVGFVTVYTRK